MATLIYRSGLPMLVPVCFSKKYFIFDNTSHGITCSDPRTPFELQSDLGRPRKASIPGNSARDPSFGYLFY